MREEVALKINLPESRVQVREGLVRASRFVFLSGKTGSPESWGAGGGNNTTGWGLGRALVAEKRNRVKWRKR